MTSCDNNLVKYLLPQLVSIEKNLSKYDVHFYLAHSRIEADSLQMLESFIKENTGITFHEAKVENTSFYESLVMYGGGQWPHEAYFTLRLQDYLPQDVDRILYIDAGDVIINGDIAPYYFDRFDGNSIIATALSYKINPVTNEQELYTSEDILTLARNCLFNSGSYVIDVEKFRNDGYTENDYRYLQGLLIENAKPGEIAYFGDQGFLAAAFVGDVKIFGYPENKDPSFMPYNFRTSFWQWYQRELDYTPVVLHYAIISKPWIVRFDENAINTIIDKPDFVSKMLVVAIPTIACMTPQHLRLGEVWWEYAKETPIYEEADIRARITAENWVKYYLPLCEQFNNLYSQYSVLKQRSGQA
jgi:lipopolysaccharide biosynthesis glycosyltransferase